MKALGKIVVIGMAAGVMALMFPACGKKNNPTAPSAPPSPSTWRVNAGGTVYVDPEGNTWAADENYSGSGSGTLSTTQAVSWTGQPTLYQTERNNSSGSFTYTFGVNPGTYQVTLKFAEIYWSSPGQRAFNVSINGVTVLNNFDIVADAGAAFRADDKVFSGVTPGGGGITLTFAPGSADHPKVSAIEIVPQPQAQAAGTPSLAYSFTTQWGSNGTAAGQFQSLSGVAARGSLVLATDFQSNRIQEFSSTGEYMDQWNSGAYGAFNNPKGAAFDSAGNIYVGDSSNGYVQKLGPTGAPITYFSGAYDISGVAVDTPGNIYIAAGLEDFLAERRANGTSAPLSLTPGVLAFPDCVAVDGSGDIYVSDGIRCQIFKFSPAGTLLNYWGGNGTGNGRFNNTNGPEGLAVDGLGCVYAADPGNNLIQKFDSNGVFLTQWGGTGTGNGKFNGPLGVAVDSSGNVYVADGANFLIQKFAPLL
jgi:sugar lactone lactonase YvrE